VSLPIERADFNDRRLGAFLQGHLDELAPTAPAESRHALDRGRLQAPEVRLWVSHSGTRSWELLLSLRWSRDMRN